MASAAAPARPALLRWVAGTLHALPGAPVLRVAIDGVDGAGKTTFADELAPLLRARGRTVIRASVDGFHRPRAARYRRGRHSPRGFYLDSYDYARLKAVLLDPLSPGGTGRYRTACFDHERDTSVRAPERQAPPGSILLFDGIFLHRPALRAYWDFSIFLDVPFTVSIPRGAQRGGTSPDPGAPENCRYVVGQQLYLRRCEPQRHATLVLDNSDLAAPAIIAFRGERAPCRA